MSRPLKCRRVLNMPDITYFKPAGIPLKILEENRLSIEELEAVRLRDIESLEQEQCAEKMNISRPTFQRVLAAARRKIADSLLNGKALRIEGGNYELASLSSGNSQSALAGKPAKSVLDSRTIEEGGGNPPDLRERLH